MLFYFSTNTPAHDFLWKKNLKILTHKENSDFNRLGTVGIRNEFINLSQISTFPFSISRHTTYRDINESVSVTVERSVGLPKLAGNRVEYSTNGAVRFSLLWLSLIRRQCRL